MVEPARTGWGRNVDPRRAVARRSGVSECLAGTAGVEGGSNMHVLHIAPDRLELLERGDTSWSFAFAREVIAPKFTAN